MTKELQEYFEAKTDEDQILLRDEVGNHLTTVNDVAEVISIGVSGVYPKSLVSNLPNY